MLPQTYRTMEGQEPGKDGKPGKYRQVKIAKAELYNLETDIGETQDVAAAHPDVVEKLMAYVEAGAGRPGRFADQSQGPGPPRTWPPTSQARVTE